MQQSPAISDETMSSPISMSSVTSLQDKSSAKTSQHGGADRAYDAENIFSSYASVKLKLVQASNYLHEEVEDEAPGSGPSSQSVTASRDLFSDTNDHGTIVNSEMASARGFTIGVDHNTASQTLNEDIAVYNEVDDDDASIPGVHVNEAVTFDGHDLAADTRPPDTGSTQVEVSDGNISSMGHRNPEFYLPTRKLDLTKKLSNKGLSDPLPGDAEETVTVKKKHNPLKRLFARKKGKFDPVSTDISQSELPCTVLEIGSHSSKKHESLQSKLKMKMGKKKSREVLDLNCSSGDGSNLEIDQIQDFKEDLSKGKCKTRGKLTKENIIVLKSTGKLLSEFGNGSVETVSGTEEEQIPQETAPYIGNRHSNGNLGEADDNQGPDDDDDDLKHLDDMLEHIYANYACMEPVLSLQDQSGRSLHSLGGDENTGVSVTVHAREMNVEIIAGKVQREETGRENIDDEAREGEICKENIDDEAPEGEIRKKNIDDEALAGKIGRGNINIAVPARVIGRGNIDGKGEMTSTNDNNRKIGMGNYKDNVQRGKINFDNINDNARKGNIRSEYTDDVVDDSATRSANFGKFQGRENGRNTEGKLPGELITGDDYVGKNVKTVENTHGKIQGRETSVDNVGDRLQDQKLGIENIDYIYDTCGGAAAEYRLSYIDDVNPAKTWGSEHFHSLGDSKLTGDSTDSINVSAENCPTQNHGNVHPDFAMKILLGFSATDRLGSLEKILGSLAGDKGSTDCTVYGADSRDEAVRLLGEAGSTPASDQIGLEVNLPNTVTDNPTDDCDESTSILEDETKADSEADYKAPRWPASVSVRGQQDVTAPDTGTSSLTNTSVIRQNGVLHEDTVATGDDVKSEDSVYPCPTSQPSVSSQSGVGSTHNEPEGVSGDLDTNDVSKLEIITGAPFPTLDMESAPNAKLRPVGLQHDQFRLAGLQHAGNITHNPRKPQIKPKPLTVQSFVHTTPVTNTHAQAECGSRSLNSVEHRPVDDPAFKVQPQAGAYMSVKSVGDDLLRRWSEHQGRENIKGSSPRCVDVSGSGELSSGILPTLSCHAQEHLNQVELHVTNCLNANFSADVSFGVNIDDHATDEVGETEERAVEKEKVTSETETQGGDFLEKSDDEILENRGQASQNAGKSSSTTSVCDTSLHLQLSQPHTGLPADDVLHKNVSARQFGDVGKTCESELGETHDYADDNVVNKIVDKNRGFRSHSNIDVETGAVSDNILLSMISKDGFKTTEKPCSHEDGSTTYTRDPSTRDTPSSRYYECVVGHTISNDGRKDNDDDAIAESSHNDGASDYPKINVVNRSSILELKSCMNILDGETDRDNIYEEISEDVYVQDVSCLTSKRFQFPWKKREKKSDKRGDMIDGNNIGAKEKGKSKPTKTKPAIKPKPVLKVSECSRTKSYAHNDKPTSTKQRSGKVKTRSGSFTLPAEESLYHEIDDDLNHRQDVMEDYSSSSSSTSDDNLCYETVNYSEDIKKGEAAAGLPQETTRDYPKSLLYSADSLGYEIPAKISLTGIERANHNTAADTRRGGHLVNQDYPSPEMVTDGADDNSQLPFEPDSSFCEGLPAVGQDTNCGIGKLVSSSVATDLTLALADVTSYERSYSRTVLSGGMAEVYPQASNETASGDDKALPETFHAEIVGTCQSFARIQVSGFSAGNSPTKVVSLGEITENIAPEGPQMLQGVTPEEGDPVSTEAEFSSAECANADSTTAKISYGECASSQDSATHGRKEGSSRGRGKELEMPSMEERVKCRNDPLEDRSCGSYDNDRLAENTTEDSFSRSISGTDQKTSRLVGVKRLTHSEVAGKVSPELKTKVSVDTHITHRQESALDVDIQTLESRQSALEVDKKLSPNVVKNRDMLAGYNQVVKSLAAFFVSNKDSENMHAEPDHTSSLETRCSEIQDMDVPNKLNMHINQSRPLSSKDMPPDLHPTDATSTHPQSISCFSEPVTESPQFVHAGSVISPQGDYCQKEIQGHQTVLLSGARSPPHVPGWSGRSSLYLKYADTSCARKTVTVTRSFDSRIYTGSNSHGSRPEVFRRASSWPVCLKSQACKVAHFELGSGSFWAPSVGKIIYPYYPSLRQHQQHKTELVELILRKPTELQESRFCQEGITSTDATSFPSTQTGTDEHKKTRAVPPIPDTVAIRKTHGKAHLTVATENEADDDMPEYDLPPIRAKRISQSKIFSWPGLSISGTTQPPAHTAVLAPAERPYPAGGNRAEYAAPWEGKGLETLGSAPAPHNMPSSTETVHEPESYPVSLTPQLHNSHTTSCGQLAPHGDPTSRSTETLDKRFVFSLASRGKPNGAGHGDMETTKMFGKKHHKLPSEDDEEGDSSGKKSGFLRMMASLFHRKKRTFSFHDNYPEGDEGSSLTTEEDSASFDLTGAPPEEVSAALSNRQTVTNNTLPADDTGDRSMATVTRAGPLCRLLKLEDDQTRTIELVQPWLHFQGLTFTRDSPHPGREGVFVAPFVDRGSRKLLAGFLDVGDQVLQVDGLEVSNMSLGEIHFLIQSKPEMTIRISPNTRD